MGEKNNDEILMLATQAMETAKTAQDRITEMKKEIAYLDELVVSVKLLTEKMTVLSSNVDEMKTEMKEITKRPMQWWDKIVSGVIAAITSGFVALIISNIFK